MTTIGSWIGPSNKNRAGNFNTAADWNTGTVPGSTTSAYINAAGTYTVTSGQSDTVATLSIGDVNATLALSAGTFSVLGSAGNAGAIAIGDGSTLELAAMIMNNGTVTLGSTGHATSIAIAGSIMFKGAGTTVLGDAAGNAIVSNGANASLVNISHITGSGTIGDAHLMVTNGAAGVIDATGSAAALIINAAAGMFKNQGTLEATGSAGLIVEGGTNNTGTITIADGSKLELTAMLMNGGSIDLDGTKDATSLIVSGNIQFKNMGGGTVVLGDSANNAIVSNGMAAMLVNNQTITGSGTIGDVHLMVTNAAMGVMDATGSAAALIVNAAAGMFKNQGLLEATGSAGLIIEGGATNTGTITIADGSKLELTAMLMNGGSINLDGTKDAASLIIDGNIQLKDMGGGTVVLGNSAANAIVGNGMAAMLVNNQTITGSGTIGDGFLAVANGATGVINATGSAAALVIDAAAMMFKNQGLVEANGSAGLTIDGVANNMATFAAKGGTFEVTGMLSGTGQDTISNGATLALDSTVVATQTITFMSGSTGTLALGMGQHFSGTVAGFAGGDAIDLKNFAYVTRKLSLSVSGTGAAGTNTLVSVKEGNLTATIALLNQYGGEFSTNASAYTLSSDHNGTTPGTLLELTAARA